MAREKGAQYPSDHRRYFRVLEDILDSPTLANVRPDVFRFYIRLLALLNRTKNRDGEIILSRQSLNFCAVREQRRHALSVAREGAVAGLYTMSDSGLDVLIRVPNWSKHQGFAPVEPQPEPAEPPAPNPVPNPAPTPTRKESAARERARTVWPTLVERAKEYGGQWSSTPGRNQVEIIAARISDGANEEQLSRAVVGYIRKHGTEARDGFDPMRHFTATTIFRASKFDANVEGSYLPDPNRKTKPGEQHGPTSRQLRARALLEKANRERGLASEHESDSPQQIGDLIDRGLRSAEARRA